MISQTAEYALRAIVWLARHPDTSLGTPHIAAATHVPPGYMSKVLQALARSGLVVSQPGRRGGFQLTRPPSRISVLEVINSVDPIQRIHKCPLDLKSHGATLCPLHKRLDEAMASVEEAFSGSTIEDLISDPTRPSPLCESGAGLGQSSPGRPIGVQIARPDKGPEVRRDLD